MNQYEGMFLFDPTFGSTVESCEGEVRRIMDRAQAELVFCRKWDDRRLAYRIKGRKRGVYMLTYFRAPSDKIVGLERDAALNENILRLLILRADGLTPEHMERACALRSEERSSEGAVEGDGGPRHRHRRPGEGHRPRRSEGTGPRDSTNEEPTVVEKA